MLRTDDVKDDAVDVFIETPENPKEIIFTVWRADGENDKALLARAGNIAKCVNDEIKRKR